MRRMGGVVRQQRELVGQQVVHGGMGLLGLEDPRDRVTGASGTVERSGRLAQARVRVERLDARDREQLAATLVADQAHAREGLQAPAETAARAAHALRDRADPPALRRVEMEDAVGLAGNAFKIELAKRVIVNTFQKLALEPGAGS